MTVRDCTAVIDIGKTRRRLQIVETETEQVLWASFEASAPVERDGFTQLDVEGVWAWLVDTLAAAPHKERIGAIVPVAHGAAAVFIDAQGRVVAAPDYESDCFEQVRAEYDRERDAFASTLSPALPLGLNLGAQIYWLEKVRPDLFARTAMILPYPQFYSWKLSGVGASEVTSFGSHTDLWRPAQKEYSALARTRGWDKLFAPVRSAFDTLGVLRPDLVKSSGLPADCRIICGIHDSNASYLGQIKSMPDGARFGVVSSGTWTIIMAAGADLGRLDETRDMLSGVDAFGAPVATARFMGGREYEAIGDGGQPNADAIAVLLSSDVYALPHFAAGGPFPGQKGAIVDPIGALPEKGGSLATLYSALMTEVVIENLGIEGDVIVDGPFARNTLFPSVLAALLPNRGILVSHASSGVVAGACVLARGKDSRRPLQANRVSPLEVTGLSAYRDAWRTRVAAAR